ncbi:auxin-responsive protein SAUR50-like [Durio zibethinus]|uniref:Auxin-responsive protein SAUR50-like n=1 Tax=Durio zibethinus TaxID=66656 RepID=A0A6P5ZNF8_DURZI|nr:auxin-responsive protein SAUR50-like [Durio zibethinus]
MAKLRSSSKKKNGIVKLKIIVEKLHKGLFLGRKWNSFNDERDEIHDSTYVPEDVKKGHFAVVAEYGKEPRRFVVPLSYLTHPKFLMLLEQAAEEYGFNREGALTIPCRPSELERILAEQWQEADSNANVNWGACEATIQSYRNRKGATGFDINIYSLMNFPPPSSY